MEYLESCVSQISNERSKNYKEIEKSINSAIYKVSSSSVAINNNIDSHIKRIFNADFEKYKETPNFSPEYVYDLTDPENIKRNTTYDKSIGILPNRYVVGKYECVFLNNHDHTTNTNHVGYKHDHTTNTNHVGYKIDTSNKDLLGWSSRINNCCSIKDFPNYFNSNSSGSSHVIPTKVENFEKLKNIDLINVLIKNTKYTLTLEVDNYLNLRINHAGMDIYIIYNYTSFPLTAFHAYQKFSNYNLFGNDIENVFKPFYIKLIMNNLLINKQLLDSLDKKEELYTELKKLKPINYADVFEAMNYFRKLTKLFESDKIIKDGEITVSSEIKEKEEKDDPRDKTISELNKKIIELMDNNKTIRETMSDMLNEYTDQQAVIKTLRYELTNEKEKNIKLENAKFLELTNEIEELKSKLLLTQNELISKNEFKQKISELEFSYKKMNEDYEKMKLENEKNINKRNSLLEKIKIEHKTISELRLQIKELELINAKTNQELDNKKLNIIDINNEIKELKIMNDDLQKKIKKLTEKNNDAFVESLYESNEEIKENEKQLKARINDLKKTNSELQNKIHKYENTLKSLIN